MSTTGQGGARLSRQEAWEALARERRWPAASSAVELRSARLLLAPFWRQGEGSAARYVSAADLLPVGLPPLDAQRAHLAGLDLRGAAGSDGAPPTADTVSVDRTLPSPEGSWAPLARPIWAFHYVYLNKERFHAVDATTGRAIGPARRPRVAAIAVVGGLLFAGGFGLTWPLLGPLAALPAWLLAVGATRLTLLRARAHY